MTDHKDHVIEVSRSAYIEGFRQLMAFKGRMWRRRKKKLQESSDIKETTLFLFYKKLIKMQSGLNNELSFLHVCR